MVNVFVKRRNAQQKQAREDIARLRDSLETFKEFKLESLIKTTEDAIEAIEKLNELEEK